MGSRQFEAYNDDRNVYLRLSWSYDLRDLFI